MMFEQLKGKKVLVTGGAGFIGSHIVDRLCSLGARVTVVDNLITGKKENIRHLIDTITFIEKSFYDDTVLNEALEGVDFISHQAALRSVPKSVEIPFDYQEVNVTGTLKLFLKAKEKKVKRIVFASSSSVYGDRTDFPEQETDVAQPLSPYAGTKFMGEVWGYIFSKLYALPVVALRYFNVFGPRQSLENQYAVVVPKFITCLLGNEAPPIYGDGRQERDFTYIDNVVEANMSAFVAEDIGAEVFNVASGCPQSVNGLLKALQQITGIERKPKYLPLRLGDVNKTEAAIDKTKRLLHWQPKVDFYEGLQKTVAWFEKNRGGRFDSPAP